MSLADVLQWADSTRACGVLTIERPSGIIWMQIAERQVVACVRPESRGVVPPHLAASLRGLSLDDESLAIEMLYDQMLDGTDRFAFQPGAVPAVMGVAVQVSLQEVVMTGMQYVDEWPWVRDLYPSGKARVHRLDAPEPASLSPAQVTVLRLAELAPTLDEARLCLGLSHPGLLRKVDLLRRLGCVRVDGAPEEPDLGEQLVSKAMLLAREKQFDEAAHVFAALLTTEPGSTRIRELLRTVDREHIAYLHEFLPARAVVHVLPRLGSVQRWLTLADREVVSRINGRWDVGTLLLACKMREVETLKSLRKLQRLEAIELLLPTPMVGA